MHGHVATESTRENQSHESASTARRFRIPCALVAASPTPPTTESPVAASAAVSLRARASSPETRVTAVCGRSRVRDDKKGGRISSRKGDGTHSASAASCVRVCVCVCVCVRVLWCVCVCVWVAARSKRSTLTSFLSFACVGDAPCSSSASCEQCDTIKRVVWVTLGRGRHGRLKQRWCQQCSTSQS
jgi:hypothetical protein